MRPERKWFAMHGPPVAAHQSLKESHPRTIKDPNWKPKMNRSYTHQGVFEWLGDVLYSGEGITYDFLPKLTRLDVSTLLTASL